MKHLSYKKNKSDEKEKSQNSKSIESLLNKSLQQEKKLKSSKIIEIDSNKKQMSISNEQGNNHSTNFESDDCIVSNGQIEYDEIEFIKNTLLSHFLFKGLSEDIM